MNVDRLIHRIEKALREDLSSEALTELATASGWLIETDLPTV